MAINLEIPGLIENGFGKTILIVSIIFLTVIVQKIISKVLQKVFEKSSKRMKVDHTQFTVLRHFVSAVIYAIGLGTAVSMIPSLKTLSVSLFASAGVMAVVIGFAAQKAFSNVISGIFIAIFKPFRVGDIIKWTDKIGIVEDITLRHTIVKNFEGRRWIVPNSVISDETIENFNINDEKTCRYVEFGISYDSDIDKAMKIMVEESMKHPEFLDTRTEADKKEGKPAINCRVLGFGDSSVNIRAWVWAKDPGAAFRMGTDLNKIIKQRFDKEGIEIPFPYRTIVFKEKKRKRKK